VHKFLRTIGFSDIRRKDLEMLINDIIEHPDERKITTDSEGNDFVELSREFAPNIGIRICGIYEENDRFCMEYYYPYVTASTITTTENIEIQKHAEKETYAGICDEMNLGVTLIFYIQNVADFLEEIQFGNTKLYGAQLSSLSTEGKILFPIEKKKNNLQKIDYEAKKHNQLIAEARDGNEEAIENLEIEDMDMNYIISRRILNEDVLSIVSTYFMPYGVESDQYGILGNILDYTFVKNSITNDRICCMKVECNDIIFDVCINEKDLLGQPAIGRRFKGNVWMQGLVCL
jgi:hypothetical protein